MRERERERELFESLFERETESNCSELKIRKKGKFKLNVCKAFLAEKAMMLKSVSPSSLGYLDLFEEVEGN